MRRRWRAGSAALAAIALAGCGAAEPAALPTIGSPTPTPSATQVSSDRSSELADRWDLTGTALPPDWPDIPLPRGTDVVTAYAIGAEPRRTWTATFEADAGTALALAKPVVKSLRGQGYRPIAEYVGAAETNTGLYSFAGPTFAIYIVLGEDNERPNLVITVRGTTNEDAGLPTTSASASAATPGSATSTPVREGAEGSTPTASQAASTGGDR